MHKVNRIMRFRHTVLWIFPNGFHLGFQPTRNSAVPSVLAENPTLEPNMTGCRLTRCRVVAIWNSPKCVNWPWSLRSVGRSLVVAWSSVVNIHTSYTDLIYSSCVTLGIGARGVKKSMLFSPQIDRYEYQRLCHVLTKNQPPKVSAVRQLNAEKHNY